MSAHSTNLVDRTREPQNMHALYSIEYRGHSVHARTARTFQVYVYYPICFIQYMHYASMCKANVVIFIRACVRDSVQFLPNTDLRMKIEQLQQQLQHQRHSMRTF